MLFRSAVTISGIVALTLTPALCALLLKPQHEEARLFRPFNRGFAWLTGAYLSGVRRALHGATASLVIFALVIGGSVLLLKRIPGGFVPLEDQGYMIGSVVLPDAATISRTGAVGARVQQALMKHPAVEHVFLVNGLDVIGGGNKTNAATIFTTFKPWDERNETADDVIKYVLGQSAGISERSEEHTSELQSH